MENLFGISSTPREPDNFEASEALAKHYGELLEYTRVKLGRDDTACDLLHDVWESLVRNEQNGEGYNPDGSKYVENYGVMDWIKARICRYAKSPKYQGVNKNEVCVGMECDDDGDKVVGDSIKMAYYEAASYDDIETLELAASVAEEFEYLVSLDGVNGVQFSYILTHIEELASVKADSGVFEAIRRVGTDAMECLEDVLSFAGKDRDGYMRLVAASSVA